MENKVFIPLEIIRNSKLSPRARLIWAELSLLPRCQAGEFVVNQKELSKQLGICVSTLRRAIKALEENKLIEFVGLLDKRFKKFVFKNIEAVQEENPPTPFACPLGISKGGLNPINSTQEELGDGNLSTLHASPAPDFTEAIDINDNSVGIFLLQHWQAIHKETSKRKLPEVKSPEDLDPNLFRLKYCFKDDDTSGNVKCILAYARPLYRPFYQQWREKYFLLNGKDKRPLLNSDLIDLIVLTNPGKLSKDIMFATIENQLQRLTDGEF